MSDPESKTRIATTSPSRWARTRNYYFLMTIGLATTLWALKQLGWLFGWTAEPDQGHLGQTFDAFVILAAGVFLAIHAVRHITRNDNERQATRDRFHDKAVKAKERHA